MRTPRQRDETGSTGLPLSWMTPEAHLGEIGQERQLLLLLLLTPPTGCATAAAAEATAVPAQWHRLAGRQQPQSSCSPKACAALKYGGVTARPEQPWSGFCPFEPGQEVDLCLRCLQKPWQAAQAGPAVCTGCGHALGSISSTSSSPTHTQTEAEASSYPDLPHDQGQPQLRHLLEQSQGEKRATSSRSSPRDLIAWRTAWPALPYPALQLPVFAACGSSHRGGEMGLQKHHPGSPWLAESPASTSAWPALDFLTTLEIM